jgi:hypothetical protein
MKNKAAQQLGKLGGQKSSEAKTLAARKNASKPRGKWVTFFAYGVVGADDKLHHGLISFRSKFDTDLQRNHEAICDYISEDLQWCKATALPFKGLEHFDSQQLKVI